MFRSIRFRLTLWYVLTVMATFVVIAWATYQYVNAMLISSLDTSVTNEVKWITSRLEKQKERNESNDVVREDIRDHASYFPHKEFVEIWDSTGQIFHQSRNLSGDTLFFLLDNIENHRWLLVTLQDFRGHQLRLAMSETPSATILLGIPMESITAVMSQLFDTLAWMSPLVMLIAVIGGTILAKKSLAKVNKVTETVKRITVERLHDRIPEPEINDEIGNLISTFNAMISRLDSSFEQMKQFSADASHELRTPLTVIRTQLESALDSRRSPAELKKIVAHCLDETIRMSSTIENLLLLAKSDAGQVTVRNDKVMLQKLMEEMYEESIILASTKSITVQLQKADPAMILGDEQRLRQMLLNLIDNAIKYSQYNGAINLSLVKNNGRATITVADNGIGIPAEEVPRIFDRFYRVDRARSREMGGAGLGLSITRWIVQAHGGNLTVKSEVNKGSEFMVVFPLATST
jgi:heavy metal sensor kinase